MNSIPNILTLARILLIPLIVALFWVDGEQGRWITLSVYITACLTDFFDGRLARRWGQESKLGRLLDPIADKLLVGSVILMLCAFERIAGLAIIAAVIILCREFVISGLREFLAGFRVDVPVSQTAKWKTTIQLIALGFLIVGSASPAWIPAVAIGDVGLWIAAVLAVISAYDYLKVGLQHVVDEESAQRPARTPVASKRASVPDSSIGSFDF